MQEREPRQRVLVRARMRIGEQWCDVSIHNVSSRGMLVKAAQAPRPGAYVEIRKAAIVIVARAVWAKDGSFGVRTQDRLDIAGLVEAKPARPAIENGEHVERRRDPRQRAEDVAAREARSRRFAGAFQYGAILIGIMVAGGVLVTSLSHALAAPMAKITAALQAG